MVKPVGLTDWSPTRRYDLVDDLCHSPLPIINKCRVVHDQTQHPVTTVYAAARVASGIVAPYRRRRIVSNRSALALQQGLKSCWYPGRQPGVPVSVTPPIYALPGLRFPVAGVERLIEISFSDL
jgi:hypothetical protein